MSKNRFRHKLRPVIRTAAVVLLVVSLPPAAGESAQSQTKMKSIEERQLVQTIQWKYAISQAGKQIGSEDVTLSKYSDNTVAFHSEISLQFQTGAITDIETDMVLEEETYFPISFEMTKQMTQGGVEFTLGARYEWFSNVAVIYRTSRGTPDTLQVILPTGAAVFDMSVAHHMYVPLYWYDTESGGFTRDKQTFKIYVDAGGRIVKLDQGFLVYELSEWSQSLVREE
jgi:hypothetical protein